MTRERPKLAHELRGPLAQILLWEQIARLCNDPAMLETALAAIRRAALEQSALIDRLIVQPRLARATGTQSRERERAPQRGGDARRDAAARSPAKRTRPDVSAQRRTARAGRAS